jgi:UDP-N-acetylglucosamine 2-epimerase (non-hydrolysing)
MKIISVVGARPNFMKVAPLHRALLKDTFFNPKVVHTGQHYDKKMSEIFFEQLEMPKPDYFLGVGSASHAVQTATIMIEFEKVLITEKPDMVLVVGDVNSTIACILVAAKMGIRTAHIEAGLRSFDRSMPEELNRLLTDSISDSLYVTEQSGLDHLSHEGVDPKKVHFVGNLMIDSLVYYLSREDNPGLDTIVPGVDESYVLMTMHRPSNVDNVIGLNKIIKIITGVAKNKMVVFPMHPRTENNLRKHNLMSKIESIKNVKILGPLGYIEFANLMKNAFAVVTDSGGIQEETTFLQVPCLTFRDSTERPVTVDIGTNTLMKDLDVEKTLSTFQTILSGSYKSGKIPPLWDGKTAERITQIIKSQLQSK